MSELLRVLILVFFVPTTLGLFLFAGKYTIRWFSVSPAMLFLWTTELVLGVVLVSWGVSLLMSGDLTHSAIPLVCGSSFLAVVTWWTVCAARDLFTHA